MSEERWLRTGIGAADADSITLLGRDLASDLMGEVTFTELAFLLVQRRMPSAEETRLLDAVLADAGAEADDAELRAAAERAVAERLEAGQRIPGLGHPVHKVQDPRTPRIYEIAEETGRLGPHLRLLRIVAEVHRERTGAALPINGAGVDGAALADLGFPSALLRGLALLARTAGLLGHLAEEMDNPLGMPLYREVDERAVYEPPE